MDWGFVVVFFGVLLVAGILIHVLVAGTPLSVPAPAPTETTETTEAPMEATETTETTEAPTHLESPATEHAVTDYKPESWCFVHEDMLGRWCVKTPSPTSCDPQRRFANREACEMVSASALPLGIVENRGAGRRTFLASMANGLS